MATVGGSALGGAGGGDDPNAGGRSGGTVGGAGGSRIVGQKTKFAPEVIAYLNEAYEQNPSLKKQRTEEISAHTQLTLTQVTDWFKYRRRTQRERVVVARLQNENETLGNAVIHATGTALLPLVLKQGPSLDKHMDDTLPEFPHNSYDRNIIQRTSLGPIIHIKDLPTTTNPPGDAVHHDIPLNHSNLTQDAVNQLFALTAKDTDLWETVDGREILNLTAYEKLYPKQYKDTGSSKTLIEASRSMAKVSMGHQQLANMLTNVDTWCDLFPTIVSKAITIQVLSQGASHDNPDGLIQLMYKELMVTSPLVPNRKFIFIRTCEKIDQSSCLIVDVSFNPPKDADDPSSCWRHPSGCLIEYVDEGSSEVTWVEHLEVRENTSTHMYYADLLRSGLAYGASRWVSCLQRSCERIMYEKATEVSEGSIQEQETVMYIAKKMVRNFFAAMGAISGRHVWSSVSGCEKLKVHTTLRDSTRYGNEDRQILVAATTFTLPYPPDYVFSILDDQSNRHEWDVPGRLERHKKIANFITGIDPRNQVSTSSVESIDQTQILQESSIDQSGSLIVWTSIDKDHYSVSVREDLQEDSYMHLLPSGFAISSASSASSGASSSSTISGHQSIVTMVVQLMVAHEKKASLLSAADLETSRLPLVHTAESITIDMYRRVTTLLQRLAS